MTLFGFASVAQWASLRLAVGSSLFITYFIFYCAYWYTNIKQQQKPIQFLKMNDLASKLYLFGLGALLSLNYNQASVFSAIFTYFSMVLILILVAINLMGSISQSARTKIYLIYYSILFAWYLGIMIDFYTTWKNVGY